MGLILARHLKPEVESGICYGITEVPLGAGFESDAEAFISDLPEISAIISSPLGRCRRLAERVSAARMLQVQIDPDWREIDFGRWEDRPWDDIPRAEIDGWAADLMGYAGHGGESVEMLAHRVDRAMDRVPEGALVLTHAGPIRAALARSGMPGAWEAKVPFGAAITL